MSWAKNLDMGEALGLLKQTLDQEKATDAALTELATAELNAAAMTEDQDRKSPKSKKKNAA